MAKEETNLSIVANSGCAVCWRLFTSKVLPCEIHHPRRGTGMGQRAPDSKAIPLCVMHHRGNLGIHGLGVKGFEKLYGFTEADLLADVIFRIRST